MQAAMNNPRCANTSCYSQDSRYVFGCSERMLIPVNKCLSYKPEKTKVDWFCLVLTCLVVVVGILLGVLAL